MDEADRLCGRIAIVDKGRIVALDTPENLKKRIGGDVITIKSPDYSEKVADLNESWIENIEQYDGFFSVALHDAEEHVSELIELLIKQKGEKSLRFQFISQRLRMYFCIILAGRFAMRRAE